MAKDSSGSAVIIAALMLSLAILGGSFFLSQSLDRGAEKLDDLAVAVKAMPAAGGGNAVAKRPERGGRPDPNKRYEVAIGTAPTIGPKNAAVTIVEFSDFQ